MGIFLILLSLALLVFLVFRGIPVFFSAVLASIFCLLTAQVFTGGMSVITGMTSTARLADPAAAASYITGLASYFGNYFWMFILGAVFGKLYEVTGAANAIARPAKIRGVAVPRVWARLLTFPNAPVNIAEYPSIGE